MIHISKSQRNKPQGHPWEVFSVKNSSLKHLIFKELAIFGSYVPGIFFFRLGNLLYLIVFIIILAIGDQETTIMPSILIFFFFPFYLLKRWVIDSKRTHDLLLECYRKTKVFLLSLFFFLIDETLENCLPLDQIL